MVYLMLYVYTLSRNFNTIGISVPRDIKNSEKNPPLFLSYILHNNNTEKLLANSKKIIVISGD